MSKEDILAKHLHDALMCILSELGEEFHDKNGDELEHKDGGDLSMGGEMSGYGEWSFEFKKAERALASTKYPLPKYGSARTFRFDLNAFATREGCAAMMAKIGLVPAKDGSSHFVRPTDPRAKKGWE